MWLLAGGFVCGFAAGAAARYGRVCSMSAIEDALIGRDFRSAKAWGLALAVALVLTQSLAIVWPLDWSASIYGAPAFDIVGTLVGAMIFGFGMALVGTCSFGLLVRAGSGDMRAIVSACMVGISAFTVTAGVLAPFRLMVTTPLALDTTPYGGPLVSGIAAQAYGLESGHVGLVAAVALAIILVMAALLDQRLRRRPRLLLAAVVMGISIAGGWAVTAFALDRLETARIESLSFVAPVGRLLVQVMTDSLRDASFGVAAVIGVVVGAAATAVLKKEVRWEAFDDAREMRRHMLGAILMGIGGVLARGCTIGQGMTAASALAISAPIVVIGVIIGARIGLSLLLEGRAIWRLG